MRLARDGAAITILPFFSLGRLPSVDNDIAGINMPEPKELCEPMGMPHLLQMNGVVEILPTSDVVALLYSRASQARIIYLNASHPVDLEASYYGHSVGHWEGDTLVIDTIGLDDSSPIANRLIPIGNSPVRRIIAFPMGARCPCRRMKRRIFSSSAVPVS